MADILKPITGTALIQSIVTTPTPQENDSNPGNLGNLPIGTMINGFVINRDRQSNPILRTEYGDVLVRSDVFLKTGSEVTIRVETVAAQARARIVRVDNQSIQELIQLQQHQAPIQDDVVLQPSIAQPSSKPMAAEQAATQLQNKTMIALEAVLLKPASLPNQPTENLIASVLKMPMPLAQAVANGQSITLRVVSSDLNIASLPQPSAAAASPAPRHAITESQYQAYSSQAPASVTTAAQTTPSASAGSASAASPLPLTSAALSLPFSAMPQPVAHAVMEEAVSLPSGAAAAPPAPLPSAQTAAPQTASQSTANAAPATNAGAALPMPSPEMSAVAASPQLANAAIDAPLPANPPVSASAVTEPPSIPSAPPTAATSQYTVQAAIPNTQPLAHTIDSALSQPTQTGLMNTIVIGAEPTGETIVRTPVGVMKIFTASAPPIGSTLQVEWVATAPSPLNSQPIAMAPLGLDDATVPALSNLGQHWDSLRDVAALLQANPQAMAELSARIPNTKSKLVNDVLFFISALKSGDIRKWLGNKLSQQIEDKSPALMQRLQADFLALKAMTHDQPNPQWQVSTFPVMHDDELHQARLFIRKDEQKPPSEKSGGGVRFLEECTFSVLGEMQLDGFVRTMEGQQTGFDLVVRSQQPLDEEMMRSITAVFHAGAEETGYVGNIRFQHSLELFVRPLQNITFLSPDLDRSIIA